MNFGTFRQACLSKFDESEYTGPHVDGSLERNFLPNTANEEEEKRKKRRSRENKSKSKREKNEILRVSVVSLPCVINSKIFSGPKADSIEENEKTVNRKYIEEFNVSKLKPGFHLNVLKYIFTRN